MEAREGEQTWKDEYHVWKTRPSAVRLRIAHVGGGPTLTPTNTNYGGADAQVSGVFFDLNM